MTRHLAFVTEAEAISQDAAGLRISEDARASTAGEGSKWLPSGTTASGEDYPAGVWPGQAFGRRTPNPIKGIATAAYPIRRHRHNRKYLARDESGVEVPATDMDPVVIPVVPPVPPQSQRGGS